MSLSRFDSFALTRSEMKEIKGGDFYNCNLSASWFIYDENHPEGGYFTTYSSNAPGPCEGDESSCRNSAESGCKDLGGYGDSSFSCSAYCTPVFH